jgi:hypothetical protein
VITLELEEMFEAGVSLQELLASEDIHKLLLRNPNGIRLRFIDKKSLGHTSYVLRLDWAARVAPPTERLQ